MTADPRVPWSRDGLARELAAMRRDIGNLQRRPVPLANQPSRSGAGKVHVIVAASDAPQAWKDAADYLCDGTADQEEIETAADLFTAEAWGWSATVLLSPGIFYFSDNCNVASGQANIVGAAQFAETAFGVGGTVIDCTSVPSGASQTIFDMPNGTMISDLMIDGQGIDILIAIGCFDDCRVMRVQVRDFATSGSYENTAIGGTSGLLVEDCVVTNCGVGIGVGGRSIVSNNQVTNCGGAGIQCIAARSVIADNIVSGCGTDTGLSRVDRAGIKASSWISVTGNMVTENSNDGIVLTDPRYLVCSGNVVYQNGKAGIFVTANIDPRQALVSSNFLRDNQEHGIELDNAKKCSIVGNYIDHAPSVSSVDAIHIDNNSDDNVVLCNRIYAANVATDTRDGIRIDDSTCDNNIVAGNVLTGSTFSGAPITDNGTGTLLTWPAHATYGDNFT